MYVCRWSEARDVILNLRNVREGRLHKSFTKTAERIIVEAARTPLHRKWDVFLSYSRADKDALPEVIERLEDESLTVYVDAVADSDLDPNSVDTKTASRLRIRLWNSRALFVLTSPNARASRWVPWELGFADGAAKRVAVLPFIDRSSDIPRFKGSEYFGLYPWLDDMKDIHGRPYLWPTHPTEPRLYTRLDHWLDGHRLSMHVNP